MSSEKTRHGCLTAILILMIVSSSLSFLSNLFLDEYSQRLHPGLPTYYPPVFVLLAAAEIVCAIAVYRWKKWGFYGFVATSSITFIMNVAAGANVMLSLLSLLGVAVLYGVLQIGSGNKGWAQLD